MVTLNWATSTMSIIASLVARGKLLEDNIHSLMNAHVLLHSYVIMYVTLSCFV